MIGVLVLVIRRCADLQRGSTLPCHGSCQPHLKILILKVLPTRRQRIIHLSQSGLGNGDDILTLAYRLRSVGHIDAELDING